MLFSSLAVLLNLAAPNGQQSDLQFRVHGAAPVEGSRPFFVEWERIPEVGDFPGFDRKRVLHEATIQAKCQPAPGGSLKNCEIVDELPAAPELRPLHRKALDLLVMTASSAERVKDSPVIYVSLMMNNPGGTHSNKNYCGPPFCSIVPPPPPPPPPPERG